MDSKSVEIGDVLFKVWRFPTEENDPLLWVGHIIEPGNTLCDKDRLNSVVWISGMSTPHRFRAAGGRPSDLGLSIASLNGHIFAHQKHPRKYLKG